jgi:hypothetical protein
VRAALAFAVGASAVVAAATASAGSLDTCLPGRQAAVLVRYERTGGLAGIRDELRVRRSGRASLDQSRGQSPAMFILTCRRLRALRTALVEARFATLDPVYAPESPFADGLVESVSYGGRTVRVLTGAEPPRRLDRVLALLREIVARRR